jgi:hypothetical protein
MQILEAIIRYLLVSGSLYFRSILPELFVGIIFLNKFSEVSQKNCLANRSGFGEKNYEKSLFVKLSMPVLCRISNTLIHVALMPRKSM